MVLQFIDVDGLSKSQYSVNHRANGPTPRSDTLRQQVYLQLRQAIEQGSFPPGARLPPSREQARILAVSRNTVLWALERLQSEGYVVARVGDGSYVAPYLQALGHTASRAARKPPERKALRPRIVAGLSQRGQLIADTVLRWNPPLQPALPFRIGAPEVLRQGRDGLAELPPLRPFRSPLAHDDVEIFALLSVHVDQCRHVTGRPLSGVGQAPGLAAALQGTLDSGDPIPRDIVSALLLISRNPALPCLDLGDPPGMSPELVVVALTHVLPLSGEPVRGRDQR